MPAQIYNFTGKTILLLAIGHLCGISFADPLEAKAGDKRCQKQKCTRQESSPPAGHRYSGRSSINFPLYSIGPTFLFIHTVERCHSLTMLSRHCQAAHATSTSTWCESWFPERALDQREREKESIAFSALPFLTSRRASSRRQLDSPGWY